ncbi:O-antigen ligase family protein [Polynucleobacter sp. MWH-HuK1]|nr:O-antigen ligase family protein [Polynucleobacter sp. MWH-HuK1]
MAAKMVFWGLFVMSILFFIATLRQFPRYDGLIAFGAQYGVHICLAVMALMIIPISVKTIGFLFNCLLFSMLALILVDIGFYIWDYRNNIAIGSDYSHRWLGDGYVFLTPFLLARILYNQEQGDIQAIKKLSVAPLFFQLLLYLLLILSVILGGGTGARSTYLILFFEIVFFIALKAYQARWSAIKMLTISFLVFVVLKVALGLLAPELFEGAVSRRLQTWDRILYAWTPAILLIQEAPMMGYGFGAEVWDAAISHLKLTHPNIINFGSPHNWFLSAGFFGGIPACIAQFSLVVGMFGILKSFWERGRKLIVNRAINQKLSYLTIAVLTAFISFYLVRGLVEFTIYKYLSILIIIFGMINVVNQSNHLHTPANLEID